MALDGIYLHFIKNEIISKALDFKVDKIYQPSKEELIFSLRGKSSSLKLLISAGAKSPRIHFTEETIENPKAPPMFCMLLRKHLTGGRLKNIRQHESDRILFLDFEATNELSDLVMLTVAVEIMGRHSNIILLNDSGKVIDSVKRVDSEMSSVRAVLPGSSYILPPLQDKINPLVSSVEPIIEKINSFSNMPLSKALLSSIMGISPIIAREFSFYVTKGADEIISTLSDDEKSRLSFIISDFLKSIKDNISSPTIIFDEKGKPFELSFMSINQYGHSILTKTFENPSLLLDCYFAERDLIERMTHRSHDLLKLLSSTSDRIGRRISTQKTELLETENRDLLRIKGDIINANLYQIEKRLSTISLPNFYEENSPLIEINLNPAKTPSQNAQKYFNEYRKADNAEKILVGLIAEGEAEYEYIDSVFDALTRAKSEAELNQIREELVLSGYVKSKGKKDKKPEKLSHLKFKSSDGFLILVGRNNIGNDKLTLKDSSKQDLWLHTHNIPGSHTVIVTNGETPPNKTIEEAAILAAYHSKASNGSQVPVDYTPIKHIKKPIGAKPGKVIYETYQTAYVTPDKGLAAKLLIK